ncbi:hypothetical protein THMIRHAS_21040 [Thiosulfatimonas sediminis]|uniref:Uncharacterized protein n=1 Tax=Thiosulfatimonas sediminis TaxID=2675054 RepID=A0A6F8PX82_9GAMM|nr:hypothetical protein [Thiosulfatimonas sediminis]BBP46731.1 hypothetical protein THMIRHAS_21040 [Thiosulfatimonas sediminis]
MSQSSQKGMVLLLVSMVLVMLIALLASSYFKNLIAYFSSKQLSQQHHLMLQVKQRLLMFAVLHPEIYLTNSSSQLLAADEVPGAGYFPCPDLDGDGFLLGAETTCGNQFLPSASNPLQTGFVPDPLTNSGGANCNGMAACMGYVPQKIVSRQFYFAPAKRYFYVLDERFSFQNGYYFNDGQNRFSPLSPSILESVAPRLQLNGVDGYVLLIIDAGNDGLDASNADGDFKFVSPRRVLSRDENLDQIIGVTLEEWRVLMSIRACVTLKRFNNGLNVYPALANAQAHWLNAYHPANNPAGGGWRAQCGA